MVETTRGLARTTSAVGVTAALVGLLAASTLASSPEAVAHGSIASSAGAADVSPAAVGTSVWTDFNGDGFADLAVGAPDGDVVGDEVGVVTVLYGSASGLSSAPPEHAYFPGASDVPSMPNVHPFERFGAALASGDFDGDGYGDLAIGVPGLPVTHQGHTYDGAGGVEILFGSAKGLGPRDNLYRATNRRLRNNRQLGESLAALDVMSDTGVPGKDGKADLAIGAPGADMVLLAAGKTVSTGSGPSVDRTMGNAGKDAGMTLVAGDFNRTTFEVNDLAIGLPHYDDPRAKRKTSGAGAVIVWYDGITGNVIGFLEEGRQGTPGKRESGDHFGASLAVGRAETRGSDTLYVGAPGEDLGARSNVGVVYRFEPDTPGYGLDPAATILRQGTGGFPTPGAAGDRFGSSVAVANFGDGLGLDVAVGAPGHSYQSHAGSGAVMVSYADGAGEVVIAPGTGGYKGAPDSGDHFGDQLFAANFGGGDLTDLAIADPDTMTHGYAQDGEVAVVYGSAPSGLQPASEQLWDPGSDQLGNASVNGHFGAAMR
jgi:hypothetical protein